MSRVDARLREMQFLARLDRELEILLPAAGGGITNREQPEIQMVISLIQDGLVNGIEQMNSDSSSWHELLKRNEWRIGAMIGSLIVGHRTNLKISHKGRVRLSELEQQLRTGRDRDETGLLWAKRHLETDLAIALLSASGDAPLSVAFLDMNGLKTINDTHGHAVGNDAIRAFFQAIISTLGQHGETYRNGGDEVVVILPSTTDERAGTLLGAFVKQLGKDVLRLPDGTTELTLTASCGSVSTMSPAGDAKALLDRADKVMYRAKHKSKEHTSRVSAIAVGEGEGEIVTHKPGA